MKHNIEEKPGNFEAIRAEGTTTRAARLQQWLPPQSFWQQADVETSDTAYP